MGMVLRLLCVDVEVELEEGVGIDDDDGFVRPRR